MTQQDMEKVDPRLRMQAAMTKHYADKRKPPAPAKPAESSK